MKNSGDYAFEMAASAVRSGRSAKRTVRPVLAVSGRKRPDLA